MPRNLIFNIEGGIGKCIVATAVCKAIKNEYPKDKLIVISSYPEVFLGNPNIYKSFHHENTSYFYSDYIENSDIKLMLHNPYLESDYVKEKSHLIEIWCKMFGIKYNGELPEIFLTDREMSFFQKKYQSDKPILMMQTNGGYKSDIKYSFSRDLPSKVVLKIIEHFSDKYNIIHIRREDQIGYNNTTPIHANFREILSLSLLSNKRLLIDSFLQHACCALNLPSVVCWITNNPKVLGYKIHDNILANDFTATPELKNSFIYKFNIIGNPIEFPYKTEDDIFDVSKIIYAIEKN